MLSPLEEIFFSRPHRVCQKWRHYFSIYERFLSPYRGSPVRVLEIGASQGGSIDLWLRYFGPHCKLTSVDVNPACARFASDAVRVIIGDQGDPDFLRSLAAEVGEVDIVLDDGGHFMAQQIFSFDILFPIVHSPGIYICEDTHTSYQDNYAGGVRRAGTFVEYMKGKVDQMHHWYSPEIKPSPEDTQIKGISFFDSVVVIEKGASLEPLYVETGW